MVVDIGVGVFLARRADLVEADDTFVVVAPNAFVLVAFVLSDKAPFLCLQLGLL